MQAFFRFMNKSSSKYSTYFGLGVNVIGSMSSAAIAVPFAFLPFIDTGFDVINIDQVAAVMIIYPVLYTSLIVTTTWPSVATTVIGTRLVSFALDFPEELPPKWAMTNKRAVSLILKTNLIVGAVPLIALSVLAMSSALI